MSHTRYIKCRNNILFCLNFKVCSTTFSSAIGHQLYNTRIGHMSLDYTNNPNNRTICLFRNPIDKFIAALNQIAFFDIDEALNRIENDGPRFIHRKQPPQQTLPQDNRPKHPQQHRHHQAQKNILADDMHLLPQCRFQGNPIEYYRYPDKIPVVCEILEITDELPHFNKRQEDKKNITLTEDQTKRIAKFYERDMMIWEKIQENNGVFIVNNYYPILS